MMNLPMHTHLSHTSPQSSLYLTLMMCQFVTYLLRSLPILNTLLIPFRHPPLPHLLHHHLLHQNLNPHHHPHHHLHRLNLLLLGVQDGYIFLLNLSGLFQMLLNTGILHLSPEPGMSQLRGWMLSRMKGGWNRLSLPYLLSNIHSRNLST